MVAVFIRTASSDFRKTQKQMESCMPLVQDIEHKVYMEIDVKTIDSDRPGLSRLVADIEAGLVNKVICYSAERISRNPVELGNFMRLANQMNVPVVFAE
ncbi:recombinase family protein [Brevibacillus brevis]|uniref:recombinase family protein n=1 Tax=Brevibacillus brevis TaxID=1393 RepID=UPI00165E2368|nr:recombinase family protein [Brevibacillus brevis]